MSIVHITSVSVSDPELCQTLSVNIYLEALPFFPSTLPRPVFHFQVMLVFYEKCIMHNRLPDYHIVALATCETSKPGRIVEAEPSDVNDVRRGAESTSKRPPTK